MSDGEIGFLAGLFEGEGSIVLACRHKKDSSAVRISIANTVRPLLDRVIEITGVGLIQEKRHTNPNWATAYVWYVNGEAARSLLSIMRPWLIVKAARADAVLAGETFERDRRWDRIEAEGKQVGRPRKVLTP